MVPHLRAWAVSWIALVAGSALGAQADPADHPPAPAVALFVNLANTQLPSGTPADMRKQMDLGRLPVLISTGSTTDVGVTANHSLSLDPGLSVDTHGSISRTRFAGFLLGDAPGTERGSGQATLHYTHDWFDLRTSPGFSAEGPEAGLRLGTVLDNRIAISMPRGWDLAAASHLAQRNAAMTEGEAGRDGSASLDLTRRLASSSSIGVGYSYGWSSPESAAVSSDRQVEVSANFAFLADVNCSAQYRQSLSADAPTRALDLAMDWDLMSQGFGSTRFKADVSLQHTDPDAALEALDGTANVGLAMKF
jgi:hypothetical protein